VPKFVNGEGAIESELGQALGHHRADVTIVEEADHLLGRESADAARYLRAQFEADGIALHPGRRVTKVERADTGRTATLDDGTSLPAEQILVVTGHHPLTENLGLDGIGVRSGKQGIECDEHCRAADNVWAAGNVTGVAVYTHVASFQARIVAPDTFGQPRVADYTDIPRVTFTQPEVASVGITNPKTAPDGMDVVTARMELSDIVRTETYGKGYTLRCACSPIDTTTYWSAHGRLDRWPGSGSSGRRLPFAHVCRSPLSTTRSSPFRPSLRCTRPRFDH